MRIDEFFAPVHVRQLSIGTTISFVALSTALEASPPAKPSPPPTSSSTSSNCVPAREDIRFYHAGEYHRVHPSGNYFLYTQNRNAYLVDITDRSKPRAIKSPMREETYPVESATGGAWDYLASPTGGGSRGPTGGMQYYEFKDLIAANPAEAKPAFEDTSHGEFYHSSAELPYSKGDLRYIRTLLFSDRSFRDYEIRTNATGKVVTVGKSQVGKMCSNIFPTGKPSLASSIQHSWRLQSIEKEKAAFDERKTSANPPTPAEVEAFESRRIDRIAEAESDYIDYDMRPAYKKLHEARSKIPVVQQQLDSELNKLRLADSRATAAYETAMAAIENHPDVTAFDLKIQEQRIKNQHYSNAQWHAAVRPLHNARRAVIERLQSKDAAFKRAQSEQSAASEAYYRAEVDHPLATTLRDLKKLRDETSSEITQMKFGFDLINPVLSKDGTHVAGVVFGKLRVYKIADDGKCTEISKTNFRSGKVSFSYPQPGKPLQITFTAPHPSRRYGNAVYVHNIETGESQIVDSDSDDNVSYPGFTRDGRVMYKTANGMAMVDPVKAAGKGCIAKSSSGTTPANSESTTR